MRNRLLLFVALSVLLSVPLMAQDYDTLRRSADDVKDTAERLSERATDAFKKKGENSSATIEQAFLGEQVYAAAKFMDKIVGDKYEIGDLRLAGNVLMELSAGFPAGNAEWAALKDKISSLVFELGKDAQVGTGTSSYIGESTNDDNDIDESRILGRFFWNGEVDAEVQLAVSGTVIRSTTVSGKPLEEGSYSFTSALPREAGILVRAVKMDGRGDVTVIQQPTASNGYTAIVRIYDKDGGARPYSIEIFWYKSSGE